MTNKLLNEVEGIIEFEFNWLRAILSQEGRITHYKLDIAEEGMRRIIKLIKAGEQE